MCYENDSNKRLKQYAEWKRQGYSYLYRRRVGGPYFPANTTEEAMDDILSHYKTESAAALNGAEIVDIDEQIWFEVVGGIPFDMDDEILNAQSLNGLKVSDMLVVMEAIKSYVES